MRFDRVAIVDWSAANGPTSASNRANAIWIGSRSDTGFEEQHFRTRHAAEARVAALIHTARAQGERLLIGFDFAFGYPAGFARALTGQTTARSVWHWLASRITDTTDNRNNRFDLANAINQRLGQVGPFWSHPPSHSYSHLRPTRQGIDHDALGFAERRRVEQAVRAAKSVWMLSNPGAVGSQSLLGLPMIHRLSQATDVAVWPFDAPDTPIVLTEVYPSLLDAEVTATQAGPGWVKDQMQVRLLAKALFLLGQTGNLTPLFARPGGTAATEEGWILGAGHAVALKAAL